MLQLLELTDDNAGNVFLTFYIDASSRRAKKDFDILTSLFTSYVANTYGFESGLDGSEAVKIYRELAKKLNEENFVIDGYMIAWEMNKGYKFGATQKKTP